MNSVENICQAEHSESFHATAFIRCLSSQTVSMNTLFDALETYFLTFGNYEIP